MKQPLYGSMCAFLPAGFPHRSIVTGGSISYQSLYLKKDELAIFPDSIIIFPISELGRALFNRMADDIFQKFRKGILNDILSLFIKITIEDMKNRNLLLSLPAPLSAECCRLTEFIEANYMKNLTMNQFRSVLPYSMRHISRIFSLEMKMTLFDYLRIYRMITASAMLHDRSKSVLEISLECGYESLSSFYSDFKKFFSGTPGGFRKAMEQSAHSFLTVHK